MKKILIIYFFLIEKFKKLFFSEFIKKFKF